jgi:hypothetical protein
MSFTSNQRKAVTSVRASPLLVGWWLRVLLEELENVLRGLLRLLQGGKTGLFQYVVL